MKKLRKGKGEGKQRKEEERKQGNGKEGRKQKRKRKEGPFRVKALCWDEWRPLPPSHFPNPKPAE